MCIYICINISHVTPENPYSQQVEQLLLWAIFHSYVAKVKLTIDATSSNSVGQPRCSAA